MAVLLFRSDEVPVRALSFGFAVAAAGSDVPDPHLLVAPLRAVPGWSVAFWQSGARRARGASFTIEDEMEHARELFEDELPPGLLVQRATRELAGERGDDAQPAPTAAPVYALVLDRSPFCDDGWRFDGEGVTRRFLHDGDDGLEAGQEGREGASVDPVALEIADAASDAEEEAEVLRLAGIHGGASMIGAELRAPIASALMGALYEADERVPVRIIEPGPESAAREAARLVRVLGRSAGRGAPGSAQAIAGVAPPAAYGAFVAAYDWADPTDPGDLYRELSIGRLEGDLHWIRPADAATAGSDATWAAAAARGLYPVATLRTGGLGATAAPRVVALGPDGSTLWVTARAAGGEPVLAGPTFTELLRYLALGWSRRDAAAELVIGALMLRARVRAGDG